MIKIQKNYFSIDFEIKKITNKFKDIGAMSSFVGYVRNNNENKKVNSIYLDVYLKMANLKLLEIADNAKKKWGLIDYLVIHRYGKLTVGEKIVMITTLAKHRKESFLSCKYIIEYLKKDAPFWKKEKYGNNSKWLENSKLKNLPNL